MNDQSALTPRFLRASLFYRCRPVFFALFLIGFVSEVILCAREETPAPAPAHQSESLSNGNSVSRNDFLSSLRSLTSFVVGVEHAADFFGGVPFVASSEQALISTKAHECHEAITKFTKLMNELSEAHPDPMQQLFGEEYLSIVTIARALKRQGIATVNDLRNWFVSDTEAFLHEIEMPAHTLRNIDFALEQPTLKGPGLQKHLRTHEALADVVRALKDLFKRYVALAKIPTGTLLGRLGRGFRRLPFSVRIGLGTTALIGTLVGAHYLAGVVRARLDRRTPVVTPNIQQPLATQTTPSSFAALPSKMPSSDEPAQLPSLEQRAPRLPEVSSEVSGVHESAPIASEISDAPVIRAALDKSPLAEPIASAITEPEPEPAEAQPPLSVTVLDPLETTTPGGLGAKQAKPLRPQRRRSEGDGNVGISRECPEALLDQKQPPVTPEHRGVPEAESETSVRGKSALFAGVPRRFADLDIRDQSGKMKTHLFDFNANTVCEIRLYDFYSNKKLIDLFNIGYPDFSRYTKDFMDTIALDRRGEKMNLYLDPVVKLRREVRKATKSILSTVRSYGDANVTDDQRADVESLWELMAASFWRAPLGAESDFVEARMGLVRCLETMREINTFSELEAYLKKMGVDEKGNSNEADLDTDDESAEPVSEEDVILPDTAVLGAEIPVSSHQDETSEAVSTPDQSQSNGENAPAQPNKVDGQTQKGGAAEPARQPLRLFRFEPPKRLVR